MNRAKLKYSLLIPHNVKDKRIEEELASVYNDLYIYYDMYSEIRKLHRKSFIKYTKTFDSLEKKSNELEDILLYSETMDGIKLNTMVRSFILTVGSIIALLSANASTPIITIGAIVAATGSYLIHLNKVDEYNELRTHRKEISVEVEELKGLLAELSELLNHCEKLEQMYKVTEAYLIDYIYDFYECALQNNFDAFNEKYIDNHEEYVRQFYENIGYSPEEIENGVEGITLNLKKK